MKVPNINLQLIRFILIQQKLLINQMLRQEKYAKFAVDVDFDDEHTQVNLANVNPLITCQLCSGIFLFK